MGQEQRDAKRIEIEGEVELKILFTRSDELKEVRGQLANISDGGVFVETKDPIEEGALADLKFKLEGQGRHASNPLGLVRWVENGKGVGIEFFYGSEQEKEEIKAALAKLMRKLQ